MSSGLRFLQDDTCDSDEQKKQFMRYTEVGRLETKWSCVSTGSTIHVPVFLEIVATEKKSFTSPGVLER